MEPWLRAELRAAFDIYCRATAVCRHFKTGSYDYFKYKGKIKAKFETFLAMKNRGQYVRLYKVIGASGMTSEAFIVANVMDSKGQAYVTGMASPAGTRLAKSFQAKMDAPGNYACDQIKEHLLDECIDDGVRFKAIVLPVNGNLPKIVQSVINKDLSLEAFIIVSKAMGLMDLYAKDQSMQDNWVWSEIQDSINKRIGFFHYNESEAKLAIASLIKEYW